MRPGAFLTSVTLLLFVSGCGRLGFDPLSPSGTTDASASADAARSADAAAEDSAPAGRDGDVGGDDASVGVDAGPLHDDPDPSMSCPINVRGLNGSGETVITGTTRGGNGFAGACGGRDAPEARWRVSAGSSGDFVVSSVGSSFDTVVYLRDDECGGVEVACNDDEGPSGGRSRMMVRFGSGQSRILFVDGKTAADSGDYQIVFYRDGDSEAADCADGLDNDGDGTIDCLDPDCSMFDPAC